MTYRLKVKNFQSIKDAELDFSGFVVICGKSDLGKSATRRAVETILFNDWQKSYQRTGSKKTEISFSTDGLDISCIKSKTDNSWNINGKEIPKLAKDAPELSLPFKQELNISTQLEPLFMVAYKDTENTKILNRMFGIDRLETAQYLCSLDLRRQKQQTQQIEANIETKQKEADLIKDEVAILKDLVNKLERATRNQKLIESYIKVSMKYENANIELKNAENQYNAILGNYNALKKNDEALQVYDKWQSIRKNGIATKKALKELATIPDTQPLSNLLALMQYNNTIKAINDIEIHPIWAIKFSKCKGISKLSDYLYVIQRESELGTADALEQQIKDIEAQLSRMVCPTCRQPLTECSETSEN